ncbi:MAG: 16S rRNA (adenine(1518)-N(6)/adenine(1519)-N(6))-dimethyltransferase RsmA [Candidatus Brocadiia bacterium]|jgi:16S rRNA (adenine1518-N6/adenine1519-N6)-dimethyltransferase
MTTSSIPTAAELKALFTARGIRPSRVRGQNFLVDAALMRRVVEEAELDRRDVALEIGAGTGGLTGCLAEAAGVVVAVEVDRKLHALAEERLAGLPNVRLIHADAMGPGAALAPEVRDAVAAAMDSIPGARLKLVANLPYAVSTAVISALLLQGPVPCEMVVTVQREVADRICAAPGTEAYGYLSVIVQATARTQVLRRVSPGAFWPQPEVDSSILRVRPDAELRAAAGDLEKLRQVASDLFRHRRKQAARSLLMARRVKDREAAVLLLAEIGATEAERCEQFTVAQFIRLAKLLS